MEVRADLLGVCVADPACARLPRARAVVLAALVLAASSLLAASSVLAASPSTEVAELIAAGRFREAEQRIASALSQDPTAEERRALEFERERMRRIRLDFPHDRAKVAEQLKRDIPDLDEAEFARWDEAGLFEHLVIDGERCYFDRAASNLFRLEPAALARRDPQRGPLSEGPFERLHPHHAEVRAAALASGKTSVAPRRVRVTHALTVEADAVPAGESVRAWIPYPRVIDGQQSDIVYLESTPKRHVLAPESALQRTIHLERRAERGAPTRFSVSYELTVHARYHAIDPARVNAATQPVIPATAKRTAQAGQAGIHSGPHDAKMVSRFRGNDEMTADLAQHLAERPPHIVFTPAVRAFSARAVGDATQPHEIAKRLFDAVDRIPWAGAREYSTLPNIPEHTLARGYGDCGQQTLLLITLLRLNGIPARWQSGWVYSDEKYSNLHDWGALHLAPYGWIPVDVTTGKLAGADPSLEYFYLGGLDAYRIAMNDDWGREFVPPKRHFRSETVDSQRGEAEWDGGNLYFDQWDYDFEWKLVPLTEGTRERDTNPTTSMSGEGA